MQRCEEAQPGKDFDTICLRLIGCHGPEPCRKRRSRRELFSYFASSTPMGKIRRFAFTHAQLPPHPNLSLDARPHFMLLSQRRAPGW